jgi:excisionase family DNA binding protein
MALELEQLRTLSVPEAGAYLGLGRDASYVAAHKGELPTVRIGKRYRVPVVVLEKLLADAGKKVQAA